MRNRLWRSQAIPDIKPKENQSRHGDNNPFQWVVGTVGFCHKEEADTNDTAKSTKYPHENSFA